jgi:hypothetical protein
MRAEPLDRDALARAMADVRAKTTAVQAFFPISSRREPRRNAGG